MNSARVNGRSPARIGHQKGVATLIVVLILFFVVSMVAAYTNRNLIFEQRTSSNQYRSTQALEAADAGLEWVIAALNIGRVDDNCAVSTSSSDLPLRQRLLAIDATGRIVPTAGPSGEELSVVCVFNGSGWTCSCPTSGTASVTPPSGSGSWPAFRVRFRSVIGDASSPTVPRQPGVVKAQVVGCTRADSSTGDQCLQFTAGQGAAGEGRVLVSALLALSGTASSPPQAALVVRRRVDVSGTGISAYNSIAGGSGITIQSGGDVDIPDPTKLVGQPGSPGGMGTVIQNDSAMGSGSSGALRDVTGTNAITAEDRMFAAVFNLRPDTFRDQPATVQMACGSSGCSAADVRGQVANNPWRPIWLNGDLNVDSSGDIGSAAQPVLLVVNGGVAFSVSTATIYGVVYVRTSASTFSSNSEWSTSGGGQIIGSTVADEKVDGHGTTSFVFDPGVMSLVRWKTGSFVRVPGSWKDFE
jgi:hypothetical protein